MNYRDYRDLVRTEIFSHKHDGPLFNWVDINPTELCNRTCLFCPRGEKYPNQNIHITSRVIDKITQDLFDVEFTGIINICGNGEPLLSKNIYPLIESLSDYNLEMVSNGDNLTNKNIKILFDLGLNHLNVSCYDGEHQIDYFNELFEGCIPKSAYTLREYWKPLPFLNNRAGTINIGNSFLDKPCYYMHYSIQIDWNGDVLFCLQSIYDKSIIHGNILTSSMRDIWYGKSMSKYRDLLAEGRKHKPCSACNVNGTMFGEKYAIKWGELSE